MNVKSNFIRFISWVLTAVAAEIIAIAVLSVFGLFYGYSGVHSKNASGATDYKWQSNHITTTMKEGFSYIQYDKNGFNNIGDDEDVDILLMGSSHMEAVNVAQNESTAALLNTMLPNMHTYNIGMSGHTIYRCVDNIDKALSYYKPSEYVIIETSTVELSISEMNKIITGKGKPIPSYSSGMLNTLQQIPAFKPLYKQLGEWYGKKERFGFSIGSENGNEAAVVVPTEISVDYSKTLTDFLNMVVSCANNADITPIIFYAPAQGIEPDGDVYYGTARPYFDLYKKTCDELGILFVDLTDEFDELYDKKHILAHGFPNTAVGVGHLNKYGHQAIAEALCETIKEKEAK